MKGKGISDKSISDESSEFEKNLRRVRVYLMKVVNLRRI